MENLEPLNKGNLDVTGERQKEKMWQNSQEHLGSVAWPHLGNYSPVDELRRLIAFLKNASTLETLYSRSIPFGDSRNQDSWLGYRLLPVGEIHLGDDNLISDLLRWRANAGFRGDSALSFSGTKNWLEKSVLGEEERILFVIVDPVGTRLGHVGLWFRDAETLELDNVVKSPNCETKGIMSHATKVLGRWVREFTGVRKMFLRVDSENYHAIGFYEKIGFSETGRIPIGTEPNRSKGHELSGHWLRMVTDLDLWSQPQSRILTAGPSIGALETCLVGEAVRSGWNDHHSDFLNLFTENFGKYLGSPYVIPTDSCTSALHLALWALDIGPGDEVIVPDVTWVATAAAVRYVGATPVFADIDIDTWCISPESVRGNISERTKAIIPVHLYGFVADLAELQKICDEHGLRMVQDAAPAIGAMVGTESITKWGDVVCYSFQGAKLLVTGEGGALVTNDEALFTKAQRISDSGRQVGTFWIEVLGKKMKMSNVTAALAAAQLLGVERQINKKKEIASWYRACLEDLPGLSFQYEFPGTRAIHWMTSINLSSTGRGREDLREFLRDHQIDSRPVFSPISRYPIWETKPPTNENAISVGDNSVNLPSGVGMSQRDVEKVSHILRTWVEGA